VQLADVQFQLLPAFVMLAVGIFVALLSGWLFPPDDQPGRDNSDHQTGDEESSSNGSRQAPQTGSSSKRSKHKGSEAKPPGIAFLLGLLTAIAFALIAFVRCCHSENTE
jgi:hypothetical protein